MPEKSEGGKENGASPTSASTSDRRRSSLAELFAARPSFESSSPTSGPSATKASGSSMASALSQAQQQSKTRRLSITTLGLSGSPTHGQQSSPFGALRRGSSTNDVMRPNMEENESAIDDTETAPAPAPAAETGRGGRGGAAAGMNPMGRRFSFGARAYGDARVSSGSGGSIDKSPGGGGGGTAGAGANAPGAGSPNGGTASKGSSPPGIKGKEGFSWSDTLRTRAERSSISAGTQSGVAPLSSTHNRARSTATVETPAPAAVAAAAAVKPVQKAPDHFQERILKGDFYMD